VSIPIITYHAIGEDASPLFTSCDSFKAHLEAFAKAGYRTIDLGQLNDFIGGPEPLPEDCIVLTFDDGYTSFLDRAFPLLQQYGFSATVYLVSDYCGIDNQWPGQKTSAPKLPLMSFDEIKSIAGNAVKIGCHTRSHSPLTKVSKSNLEQELISSKQTIEQRLGQRIETLAYPYGVTNKRVTDMARLHYTTAVTTRMGTNDKRTDPLLMQRIDSYYLDSGLVSKLRDSSAFLYLETRNFLRTIKRILVKDYC
jgi:peptidoglycan/xylan/chitin deacetylase (PgdA/CDA1 family)